MTNSNASSFFTIAFVVGALVLGALLVLSGIRPTYPQEAPQQQQQQCFTYDEMAERLATEYSEDGTSWYYNQEQTLAVLAALVKKTSYNPLDFMPVGMLFSGYGDVVIVSFAKEEDCFGQKYFVRVSLWIEVIEETQGSPI